VEEVKDEAVVKRLIQRKEDHHSVVKTRLERYTLFLGELEEQFSENMHRINADDGIDQVFHSICESLDNY